MARNPYSAPRVIPALHPSLISIGNFVSPNEKISIRFATFISNIIPVLQFDILNLFVCSFNWVSPGFLHVHLHIPLPFSRFAQLPLAYTLKHPSPLSAHRLRSSNEKNRCKIVNSVPLEQLSVFCQVVVRSLTLTPLHLPRVFP